MHVSVTTSYERIPVTREQWNALAEQSATNTIFQTYEWFESFWGTYRSQFRLFLITVYRDQTLVGLMPLILARGILGLRYLEFATSGSADYQDLLVPEALREEVIRVICGFLHRQRTEWDMLVLRNLPVDSPTLPLMRRELHSLGMRIVDHERLACPNLSIRGREADALRLIDRYSLRRRIRALQARGTLTFNVVKGTDDVLASMSILFAQNERRRMAMPSGRRLPDRLAREFLVRLALALDSKGWLHLSTLYCDGHPIACHLGFRHDNRLYWYKPSYDPDFARFSPGLVLLHHLIEHAVNERLDELDFTVGDEPFKARFANMERTNMNLRAFHSTFLHAGMVAAARIRDMARPLYHDARGILGRSDRRVR